MEKELEIKMKELANLVEIKQNLLDKEVYKISCELDKLVVKIMAAR
ncbi:MAG: Spo0E family sporulation regulatory protein-aspartic acid phosphatase [Bacillota bacterium]